MNQFKNGKIGKYLKNESINYNTNEQISLDEQIADQQKRTSTNSIT